MNSTTFDSCKASETLSKILEKSKKEYGNKYSAKVSKILNRFNLYCKNILTIPDKKIANGLLYQTIFETYKNIYKMSIPHDLIDVETYLRNIIKARGQKYILRLDKNVNLD